MDIFLLGNGYDLCHGFPTLYVNFLHTVKFLINKKEFKTPMYISDVFGDNVLKARNKNIAECFDRHKEAYAKSELPVDKITELSKMANENIWFKYFNDVLNKDVGWIDFEKEIAKVLDAFQKFFSNSKARKFKHNDAPTQYIIQKFNFFHNINTNMQHNGNFHCSDGDVFVIKIAEQIKKEYTRINPVGSGIIEIDKEKVVGDLFNSLMELADILKLYLILFVELPIPTINEVEKCSICNRRVLGSKEAPTNCDFRRYA